MKRMKKLLAFLLATMLLLTMIPISASAAEKSVDSDGKMFTLSYDTGRVATKVNVKLVDIDGKVLDTLTVEDVAAADSDINISLSDTVEEQYVISNVTHNPEWGNSITSKKRYDDHWTCILTNTTGETTFTVMLVEKPEIVGDAITGVDLIYYHINEIQILKMLGAENTENRDGNIDIESVKLLYIAENYGSEKEETERILDTGESIGYYRADPSNADGTAVPANIKGIEIVLNGEEIIIPSGKLAYHRSGTSRTYDVKLREETPYVVAFFNEDDAYTNNVYSIYAARFVEPGESLGKENLPKDPTYSDSKYSYKFINWDLDPDGGEPFLSYQPIEGDTVVYAQKALQGTEYHVMNTEGKLVDRIQELYDAKFPEDNYTVDAGSIDKARVYSTTSSTNEDYYENGWHKDGYFNINNQDVAGGNPYVPFHEATGITFTLTNGKQIAIPIDNDTPGALSISMKTPLGNMHVAELYVNPPLDPPDEGDLTDPDDDDPTYPIDGLVDKAVTIECTNADAEHAPATYGLLEGTFKVGNRYWVGDDTETGYYAVDITISAENVDKYVSKYNTDIREVHELTAGYKDKSAIITLKLAGSEWVLEDPGEVPVTYQVECETPGEPVEPDPEPDAPDDEDIIKALGDDAVKVKCDNKNHTNSEETYGLEEGMFTYTAEKNGETYKVTITLEGNDYLGKYNTEVAPDHTLVKTEPQSVEVTFTPDGEDWITSVVTKPLFIVTVLCKDGGEDPTEPDEPTPPTDEELEDLLDGKITVDCITADVNHPNENYRLFRDTYEIGDVEGNDDDGYTCNITIKAADYIYLYEETYKAHMLESADDKEIDVTLTYNQDEKAWKLPPDFTNVTFSVTCNTTQLPGEDHYYPYPYEPEDPTDPDQTGVADLLETDDHIQYLFGYPDDSFGPDRNMTRAEAAQMFYNLLKNQNVDAEPAFDDVPEGAWYATPVNVMAELGIVDGVGDDKFEPNREITRAEFTTMAMRFADVPSGGVNIFTDVKPSDWFYSYVVNSIQYGWIEGYGDGTFRPDRLITRAEVTTIVNRMLDRQADMAFVIQNRDKLTKFTDLTTEHWAYYTIVEATNEHNYKKPAIGEDWTSLKK